MKTRLFRRATAASQTRTPYQRFSRFAKFGFALLVLEGWISAQGATDPSVLTQPTNQVVFNGGTATFSVVAGGTGPFTYQWQFNGTNLPEGVITTVAGKTTGGVAGDGGPATNATLNFPAGVAVDAFGNLFIADYNNFRIREVGTNGIITTVAGNGTPGYSGDGGPATNATLNFPAGVAVDAFGNLFIADYNNVSSAKFMG
jgi:hypothetical protein